MTKLSAGSAFSACFAVPSIASINSRDGRCSPLIETSQRGGAWARGVARIRAALTIKLGSARWMTPAAIVALTLISGSASWAQTCPTSPSYSPDFTSNQSCMTLFGNGIGIPASPASFQSGGRGELLRSPLIAHSRGGMRGTRPRNPWATPFPLRLRFS